MCFTLKESDLTETRIAKVSGVACPRRTTKETFRAESLPETSTPSLDQCVVTTAIDSTVEVPARRGLRGTHFAEILPIVPASDFEQDLVMLGDRCRSLLSHFERAARLANNAASMDDFFEDCSDLLDHVGIE